MGIEGIPKPPFVVNEKGFATEKSVREALEVCGIGDFADQEALWGELRGPLAPLIAENCQARRLVEGWPEQFKQVAAMAVVNA